MNSQINIQHILDYTNYNQQSSWYYHNIHIMQECLGIYFIQDMKEKYISNKFNNMWKAFSYSTVECEYGMWIHQVLVHTFDNKPFMIEFYNSNDFSKYYVFDKELVVKLSNHLSSLLGEDVKIKQELSITDDVFIPQHFKLEIKG